MGIFIKCIIWNLIGDDFCCYIQICQLLDCQNLFWLKKQFSSIRILSVTWISLRGTDKICLFITVKLYEGQNLSLVSVSGTNGGQNQEKLMQCFIIPVCLMWWLSILSKLDCFFFYFLLHAVQYIDNQLITRGYLPMQKRSVNC